MAFGIGENAHKNSIRSIVTASLGLEDAARRKNNQSRFLDIAVKCWFTSSGRAMPLMFKLKDENEEIHQIENIHVVCSRKLMSAGIPFYEYHCTIPVGNGQYPFVLRFFPEECEWKFCCK